MIILFTNPVSYAHYQVIDCYVRETFNSVLALKYSQRRQHEKNLQNNI